jgi:hypothetical protein
VQFNGDTKTRMNYVHARRGYAIARSCCSPAPTRPRLDARMARRENSVRQSLTDAIARHQAALAALTAQIAASPGDDSVCEPLLAEDVAAMEAIATAPCENDAEFVEKLRYLMPYEQALCGKPSMQMEYGSVIVAVSSYLGAGQS